VKQRLQMQDKHTATRYRNSFHAITTILKSDGISGLYRGWVAGLATYGPYCGVYFLLYESFKKRAAQMLQRTDIGFNAQLSCAAVAAAISAAVTTPLDVVKTRIQVQSASEQGAYKNISHAVMQMVRTEGLVVFTKGMQARILWMSPSVAITMAACMQIDRFTDR